MTEMLWMVVRKDDGGLDYFVADKFSDEQSAQKYIDDLLTDPATGKPKWPHKQTYSTRSYDPATRPRYAAGDVVTSDFTLRPR